MKVIVVSNVNGTMWEGSLSSVPHVDEVVLLPVNGGSAKYKVTKVEWQLTLSPPRALVKVSDNPI